MNRKLLVLALIAWFALGLWDALFHDEPMSIAWAVAAGFMMVPVVGAFLLLGWSPRTRPAIPAILLVGALVIAWTSIYPTVSSRPDEKQSAVGSRSVSTERTPKPTELPRGTRFTKLLLPLGVSLEVPDNWLVLDGEVNRTIETAGEAAMNLSGIALPPGQALNLFRANSNPPGTYAGISVNISDSEVLPSELLSATQAEIQGLGDYFRQNLDAGLATMDQRILRFDGIRRELISGRPALVIEYVRSDLTGLSVKVQMTRLHVDDKIISLNLSYRESEAGIWLSIIRYIRSTFKVEEAS